MAQILANMSEYIQPQSLLNLNIEAEQSHEHSAHTKNSWEGINNEEEVGVEAAQEVVDQNRDIPPKEPSPEHVNTEEMIQTKDMETS